MNSIILNVSCEALLVYNIKRQLLFKNLFLVLKTEKYKQNSFLLYTAVFGRTAVFFYSTCFIELIVYISIYNIFLFENLFAIVRISFFMQLKGRNCIFIGLVLHLQSEFFKNSDWRKYK